MTLNDAAATVLSRGTLLRIIYQVEDNLYWSLVSHKVLLNKLGLLQNAEGTVIDILQEKEFNLFDKNIIGFDYYGLPAAVTAQDLLNDTDLNRQFGKLFLLDIDYYISDIVNIITGEYSKYITFITAQLEPYYTDNRSIINDLYYIRFFPNTNTLSGNEVVEFVKKDAINKYHIFKNKDTFIRPVLKKFGLTNDIINITDSQFIMSLKRVWFDYIKTFANKILIDLSTERTRYELEFANFEKLKSTYSGILTENDFFDFIDQIKEYEKIIKSIDFSFLNNCNTVKDILSCWPSALFPQPILFDDN